VLRATLPRARYTKVIDFQAKVTDTGAAAALRTYLANIPEVRVVASKPIKSRPRRNRRDRSCAMVGIDEAAIAACTTSPKRRNNVPGRVDPISRIYGINRWQAKKGLLIAAPSLAEVTFCLAA